LREDLHIFLDKHKAHLDQAGYCIIDNVLDPEATRNVRMRLQAAAEESERRGVPNFIEGLDPNERNVRVFNLLDLDPVFIDLIGHPLAIDVARHLLDDDFIVSNFTANIARPGSKSMAIHSDLAIVLPEPWLQAWSLNVIWCLDDVTGDNGGTLFKPGSHRYERRSDVPNDILSQMVPFEANAGSVVVMDGRLWHTSGANITEHEDRALLFGYYCRSFIRPQWNFSAALRPEIKANLSPALRRWLGLGIAANVSDIIPS